MEFWYGRAGRLTGLFGDFRPGQAFVDERHAPRSPPVRAGAVALLAIFACLLLLPLRAPAPDPLSPRHTTPAELEPPGALALDVKVILAPPCIFHE
jgi:hypothetical protein